MRLTLSSPSPWNAQYSTPDGQVLYETEASLTLHRGIRSINISHYAPPAYSSCVPPGTTWEQFKAIYRDSHWKDDYEEDTGASLSPVAVDLPARKERFAVVDWSVGSESQSSRTAESRIRYQGRSWSADNVFRKEGSGRLGRHRVFTGPDGREYVWKMGPRTPTLYLKDTNVVVAEFHRKCFGYVFAKSEKSSLEIKPEGEHIVELILVTFIYIEKLRREREKMSRQASDLNRSEVETCRPRRR